MTGCIAIILITVLEIHDTQGKNAMGVLTVLCWPVTLAVVRGINALAVNIVNLQLTPALPCLTVRQESKVDLVTQAPVLLIIVIEILMGTDGQPPRGLKLVRVHQFYTKQIVVIQTLEYTQVSLILRSVLHQVLVVDGILIVTVQ